MFKFYQNFFILILFIFISIEGYAQNYKACLTDDENKLYSALREISKSSLTKANNNIDYKTQFIFFTFNFFIKFFNIKINIQTSVLF